MSVRSIDLALFGSTKVPLILKLCLGMIILFGNSEEQTPTSSTTIGMGSNNNMSTIYCDISISKVYCGVSRKTQALLPTLPTDKFPKQIKTLDAYFLFIGGWQIKDEKMFKNFESLSEMSLTGPVQFSPPYNEGTMKTQLMNELFNLPQLNFLSLLYWDLRDFYSWKFPTSLKTLMMQKCGLAQLDLSANPNLVTLNLASNSLRKIPQLSNPLPPIEVLVLSNNPNIQFTVDDISNMCHLKQLGITHFNSQLNSNQRYCECSRLKNYMKEFKIVEYDPFICEGSSSEKDCSNYTLEFVRSIHENKCSNFTPAVQESPMNSAGSPSAKTWIEQHQIELGIGFLLVVSLLANVALFMFAIRSGGGQPEWDSSASMVEEEGDET